MMDSTSSRSNNPDTDLNTSRRKKRKIDIDNEPQGGELCSQIDPNRWRNVTNQQIYSSKLFQALRNSRPGGIKVRDTADRVLATTSKGKTRWSRAILTNQLSMRLNLINRKHKRAKAAKMRTKRAPNKKNKKKKKGEEVPPLEEKVRVLGRLVPGCKKVSFPSLLEETTDYIAALEMQVRAMTFLTQLLNGATNGS